MKIEARKLTSDSLMREACSVTRHGRASSIDLRDIYRSEHSPMRTQIFWITLNAIPSFVSVHLVRHKIGIEHFVATRRDDTFGDGEETRWTPVDHAILANAQALVSIARKRLCFKSHEETWKVALNLKVAIQTVDPELFRFLVPECVYRGGFCPETRPCRIREEGGLKAIKRNTHS